MMDYKDYISRLKESGGEVDYDRMYSKIRGRLSSRPRTRLVLAGALALLFISSALYFNSVILSQNDEVFMSYVFEQESIEGPLLSYVFEDANGTF